MAQTYATDAYLVELYPEAAAIDSAVRVRWLLFARGVVHLSTFEAKADDAHAAMTMHLLAMQGLVAGEEPGAVTSMALGPGSVSFDAGAAVDEAGLGETKYGKQYKLLQESLLGAVWVA